jgi:hypothetical protein
VSIFLPFFFLPVSFRHVNALFVFEEPDGRIFSWGTVGGE